MATLANGHAHRGPSKRKLIIDTDPGCDDAMAILAAFNHPDVDILGLTTIYGNVLTPQATTNALRLVEMAERPDVPVAPGASHSLRGHGDPHIADFVHGSDGFGNTHLPQPQGQPIGLSAAEFIVQQVNKHPGQVTVLALAALTNVALAVHLDPTIARKWEELMVLGGAFHVNGNVNPAAEANIYGDADAADFVFAQHGRIRVVGLDVTHQCQLSAERLEGLRGKGRFGTFIADCTKFYVEYHQQAYKLDGCHCHDPTAFLAVLHPELFTFGRGRVRVVTEGVAKGCTIIDEELDKKWHKPNAWTTRPVVEVAVAVKSAAVIDKVFELLQQ